MLVDFGAAWSYAQLPKEVHEQIERIDVRAFGIFVQVGTYWVSYFGFWKVAHRRYN